MMAKIKGNPASVEGGFFVGKGGSKPGVIKKHKVTSTAKRKRVEAAPRVGVFKR